MKRDHLICFTACASLVATATAGSKAKEVIPPPQPTPEPVPAWQWFAGGSAGYLLDFEEPMYHGHVGVEFPTRSPWKQSLFLEVGWTETEESDRGFLNDFPATLNAEFEILPVTLNYKIERDFGNAWHAYAGLGGGVAFTDYSGTLRTSGGGSATRADSDEVFVGQLFAGVGYNVTPNFELYGGARYIYLDDPEVTGVALAGPAPSVDLAFEEDGLLEAGFRYNF